MMSKELLSQAVLAPSGDNCQPWEFRVREQAIDLFNIPQRDTSLFNFLQRASLVAHGAVIENIAMVASATGYVMTLQTFPEGTDSNLVATLQFESAPPGDEPLVPFLAQRATNRKRYRGIPLSEAQRAALLEAGGEMLRLVEDRQLIKMASRIAGTSDRLAFENIHLHRFLFDHIRWNDNEARITGDGLDIGTLELNPADAAAFRLFRYWPIVRSLNLVGCSRIVAGKTRALVMSAGAVGLVTAKGDGASDFLAAGRDVQRIWLEATRAGLAFQPMTGITFLMGRVARGDTEGLTQVQVEDVRRARLLLDDVFGSGGLTPVMLFRVGESDPPSVRSLRMPLEKVIKTS